MTFFDNGTPRPELLGTCRSREEFDSLKASIPDAPIGYGEPPQGASDTLHASFADWSASYEEHVAATKHKTTGRNRKRRNNEPPVIQMQRWCSSLTRAQRYLGLRRRQQLLVSPIEHDFVGSDSPSLPTEAANATLQSSLDLQQPAPFICQGSPILISVDVESAERNHSIITEVGVSTLDTNDLKGLAPGEHGKNWRSKIRSRHFRVAEYAHLRNHEFVDGCPDRFRFGNSEMVALADMGEQIDRCFEWPHLSNHVSSGAHEREAGFSLQTSSTVAARRPTTRTEFGLQEDPQDRLILLVGHGVKADIEYFSKLGSAAFSPEVPSVSYPPASIDTSTLQPRIARGAKVRSSIGDVLDTASLYKVLTGETNQKSLAALLLEYDIIGWDLHNAGNDARYTLEALLGMIIQARLQSDEARAGDPNKTSVAGSNSPEKLARAANLN
jgi:hypothetical protein